MKFYFKQSIPVLSLAAAGMLLAASCNSGSNKNTNATHETKVQTENQNKNIDLSLKDENGKTFTLSSLKGKVVFINFWATWCPPCKAELPSINQLKKAYKGNNDIVFLMVDVNESIETASNFIKQNNYDLPVFVPEGDIPTEFVDNAIPSTAIINKEGAIAKHIVGASDYASPQIKQLLDRLIAGSASGMVKE